VSKGKPVTLWWYRLSRQKTGPNKTKLSNRRMSLFRLRDVNVADRRELAFDSQVTDANVDSYKNQSTR
jgi:hypothetical protein